MVAHPNEEADEQVAVQQHERVRRCRWQGLPRCSQSLMQMKQDAMCHLHVRDY